MKTNFGTPEQHFYCGCIELHHELGGEYVTFIIIGWERDGDGYNQEELLRMNFNVSELKALLKIIQSGSNAHLNLVNDNGCYYNTPFEISYDELDEKLCVSDGDNYVKLSNFKIDENDDCGSIDDFTENLEDFIDVIVR
jgi:hypothetical protein